MNEASRTVDLSNCDREPIHLIAAVQPFGFLLAVSGSDWLVTRASGNVSYWLQCEPSDLLGLYQGTPLNERGWGYGNQLPDRITLYQAVIEDDCDGDEDEIVVAIGETLIHELGHYFGMSEDQIMAIEERYWRGEPEPDEGA